MGHVPVVYLPPPWEPGDLALDPHQRHHLERVLRLSAGSDVEYRDGSGTCGRGVLEAGLIRRGDEWQVPPLRPVTVFLAPPRARDRQRFAVEKLVELGVSGIGWLETFHGGGRPARPEKVKSWAVSALEQSRGPWLPELSPAASISEVVATNPAVFAADIGGTGTVPGEGPVAVLIGPEAGWAPHELPPNVGVMSLSANILRTETAAVVAAARFLYG